MPLMGYDSYEHIRLSEDILVARFMGPSWGPQDPGVPHVGPMNLAIWVSMFYCNHNKLQDDCLFDDKSYPRMKINKRPDGLTNPMAI